MQDFQQANFSDDTFTHLVYEIGKGPAVVLMHELPGMAPECVDLARDIAHQGFRVYVPLLFGEADRPGTNLTTLGNLARLCISREIKLLVRKQSSPITIWLRALCRKAHQECGGSGVGVIGMCLTGGFVLSMLADESVIAPIMSQPSWPPGSDLGLSEAELAQVKQRTEQGLPILALRFSGDKLCTDAKIMALEQEFGPMTVVQQDDALCWRRGKTLELMEINSLPGNPFGIPAKAHAVLTIDARGAGHPTDRAKQRVLEFLGEQLRKSAE
jgi:dienelactone hydrolase